MRGCERKIIMLKGTGSEIFDEAYFLIRRDFKEEESTGEIVHEAQRIVDMNTTHRRQSGKCKSEKKTFLFGALCGFVVGLILAVIF